MMSTNRGTVKPITLLKRRMLASMRLGALMWFDGYSGLVEGTTSAPIDSYYFNFRWTNTIVIFSTPVTVT